MSEAGKRFELFTSFEAENRAEALRRSRMEPAERLREFEALLTRVRGPDWGRQPIERTATVERVDWATRA